MRITRTMTPSGRCIARVLCHDTSYQTASHATDGSYYCLNFHSPKGERYTVRLTREDMKCIAETYNTTQTED